MKRKTKRMGALLLSAAAAAALLMPLARADTRITDELTILFTHDTHSHFLLSDDGDGAYGGYTRLATLLAEQRDAAEAAGRACVTLDGGDFSMGSLFQTIYTTQAAELRTLGALGYDVTTLGNHEFDYRGQGLADMLNAAVAARDATVSALLSSQLDPMQEYRARYGPSTVSLPAIVEANYTTPEDPETGAAVTQALENYPVTDYTIVERDGLRVAVFGIMGISSDDYAPMSGMVLEDPIEAAQRVMEELQAKEDYDYVVCLSHSGTEAGEGEDYELAKAVDGIDVIISGHTHTTLEQPIEVNDTLIVSCGEYTKNLGVLTIGKDGGSGATVQLDYQLIPVTEEVPEDPAIAELTEQFKTLVEEDYLADYGYTFDQVLAQSPFDFTPISQFGLEQEEDGLGNLIADSYVYAVEQAEGADYVPVDFAVVASGVIRGSFAQGPITVSDVFNVSSLGSGADGTPGYPLISVWITGKELKDAFEVDASVTPLMSPAQLYGAGMTWTYNTSRMIFNKVTDCAQVLPDGSQVPLEDDRLYRVVTGLYSGQMLSSVEAKSFGLLAITPKTADGTEVTDFEAQIIHNADGTEVKEWYALASYLENLETVPTEYAQPQGRKVVYSSLNPVELLKHPNWITLVVLAVVLVVLAVLVFVVYRIATRGRRRRRGGSGRQRYRPYRGR